MTKKPIKIKKFPIALGQFLKLADVVSDGIEAKVLISSGIVQVNGLIETRRGKKLYLGDKVFFDKTLFICTSLH